LLVGFSGQGLLQQKKAVRRGEPLFFAGGSNVYTSESVVLAGKVGKICFISPFQKTCSQKLNSLSFNETVL
jgi:hypothetical protein